MEKSQAALHVQGLQILCTKELCPVGTVSPCSSTLMHASRCTEYYALIAVTLRRNQVPARDSFHHGKPFVTSSWAVMLYE